MKHVRELFVANPSRKVGEREDSGFLHYEYAVRLNLVFQLQWVGKLIGTWVQFILTQQTLMVGLDEILRLPIKWSPFGKLKGNDVLHNVRLYGK